MRRRLEVARGHFRRGADLLKLVEPAILIGRALGQEGRREPLAVRRVPTAPALPDQADRKVQPLLHHRVPALHDPAREAAI